MILLQLQDGKADIVVTADELVSLLPPRVGYANMLRHLENRVIVVAADVMEAATGTVLSGNSTVRCTSIKYVLNYLEITPTNFKPGLTVSAYVRMTVNCWMMMLTMIRCEMHISAFQVSSRDCDLY